LGGGVEIERSFFQLPFGILFSFHSQYTNLGGGEEGLIYLKNNSERQGQEIHHSRFAEVSMQRFDLSTKRYLLDK
jgi:hypothetical protein